MTAALFPDEERTLSERRAACCDAKKRETALREEI
jgi:hypothetical protein